MSAEDVDYQLQRSNEMSLLKSKTVAEDQHHTNARNASGEGYPEATSTTLDKEPSYQCEKCKRTYHTRSGLQKHRRKQCFVGSITGGSYGNEDYANMEEPITDLMDSSEFADANLCDSGGVAPPPSPFLCTVCGVTLATWSDMLSHQRVPCGGVEQPFKCNLCASCFSGQHLLTDHLACYHRINLGCNGVQRCVLCFSTFSSPTSLCLHMLEHLGGTV